MIYKKLHRTWSHNDLNYIPRFKEIFPELKKVSSEELADRFIDLDLNFYSTNEAPVSAWLRLTLPFALLAVVGMFLFLPIHFVLTGSWKYKSLKVYNWLKALRIL
jgi:hypothetical protein